MISDRWSSRANRSLSHNRDDTDHQPEPHRALLDDLKTGLPYEEHEVLARPHRVGRRHEFVVEPLTSGEDARYGSLVTTTCR